MSVPAPAPAPAPTALSAPRNVPALLVKLLAEDFTGSVEVSGAPGGTIHLRRGLVIAVDTPNAPSVETLLIRSGRIDEAGWAVHEGAAPPELATCPGESPRTLAEETTRRINALSHAWGSTSLGELAAVRCRPAARIDPGALSARQQSVLLAANGRRTPRDIAFFLGCGVFPAMLDITRLRARRLVEWEAPRTAALPITARRAAPAEAQDGGMHILPRRQPRSESTEGKGSS